MQVYLIENNSESYVIGKSLTSVKSVNAVMKKDSSIINPILELLYDGAMTNINYMYIPEFDRYYFISDVTAITGSRYKVSCKVDVLESFKADILQLNVILDNTESTGKNSYLEGSMWVKNVKNSTSIIPFSSGLLESGEYILITAGG